MAHKPYDPLHFVPPPDVVRRKLTEATRLADRLKALLTLSEQVHLPSCGASGHSDVHPAAPRHEVQAAHA
jgi:hypothetical protein